MKDRSRCEQGEEKKVGRLLTEMEQFIEGTKKLVAEDTPARIKAQLPKQLAKLKESKDELEQLHR